MSLLRLSRGRVIVSLLLVSPFVTGDARTESSVSVPTFAAFAPVAPAVGSVTGGGVREIAETGRIDLAALNISPAASAEPASPGIGRGRAEVVLAPELALQSTSSAVRLIGTNFIPSEIVDVVINGVFGTSFPAGSDGRVTLSITTGAGFGYVRIECIGETSKRRGGSVFQVVADGFSRGVAFGPHAIKADGTGTISVVGRGYPNVTVTFQRNGVTLGSIAVGAGGIFTAAVTVPAVADDAAVYTVDDGTAGSMFGESIEERADAGTGDLNIARAWFDTAVLDSSKGETVALVGEGFVRNETVTLSSCAGASFPASPDGAWAAFVNFPPVPGISFCTLTGATSGRVARLALREHALVTNVRGMIAAPTEARGENAGLVVLVVRATPNNFGTFYVDGEMQGTSPTNNVGSASFSAHKPSIGSLHSIGWLAQDGVSDAMAAPLLIFANVLYDVDMDAETDRTIFRPSTGTWYSAMSRGGPSTATPWGISSDIDVLGDYDGDSRADLAVWRPSTGTWYIVQSTTGTVRVEAWGQNGDIPLAGDVDGDGRDDLVVFRPSAGAFFYKKFGIAGTETVLWGTAGDQPLLADFDFDGRKDPGVYRPSTGTWYVLKSNGGTMVASWGTTGDIPVVGDFDGDGIADVTIFRPSTGQWYVKKSTGGTTATTWGTVNDIPVAGDWDGDGINDFTIWRPSNGAWFTLYSSGGSAAAIWGTVNDRPSGRAAGT